MRAQIVLFDTFDPLDAVAPFEVFTAAGIEAELVAVGGPREVVAGVGGLVLRAGAFEPERPGIVLVPGAAGEPGEIPDLLARAAVELGAPLALSLASPEVLVATVCGGSLVLAFAGLIGGRAAVTHHLGMDVLAERGVEAVPARVVDDGDLVSGGGVTSGLDLALHVVARELGARAALDVENLFDYERRGTVWTRGATPAAPASAVDPVGAWDVTIATPVGRQTATLRITRDGAALSGVAEGTAEDAPLRDLTLAGDRLTWTQSVTKPLRLTLRFAVTITGDSLRGEARAGRLPSSTVTGARRGPTSPRGWASPGNACAPG